MMADGHCGEWVPDASVQHIIPADRLTHQYIRAWQVGIGESIEVMKNRVFRSRREWAWRKLLLHSRLQTARLRYLYSRHVVSSVAWGKYYVRVGFLTGRLKRLNRMAPVVAKTSSPPYQSGHGTRLAQVTPDTSPTAVRIANSPKPGLAMMPAAMTSIGD